MLLPRMAALGDNRCRRAGAASAARPAAGDLAAAPAIALAELILARDRARDRGQILPAQAVALAGELARLLDQAHAESVPFAQLERLVPAELAEHWQVTVEFLRIVTEFWPALLAAEGTIDAAERRNLVIAALIEAWRAPAAGRDQRRRLRRDQPRSGPGCSP
ncbi:MAG: hypothetical protein WDN69_04830 [Aliidongia sp.]